MGHASRWDLPPCAHVWCNSPPHIAVQNCQPPALSWYLPVKSVRMGSKTHWEQSTKLALLLETCSELAESLIRSSKWNSSLPQEALPSPALWSQPHMHFFAAADDSHTQGSLKGRKKRSKKKRWQLSITKSTLFFLLLLKHQKNIRPRAPVLQQHPFPSLWLDLKEERGLCGDISRRSLTSTINQSMAVAASLASPQRWHSNAACCCRESPGENRQYDAHSKEHTPLSSLLSSRN